MVPVELPHPVAFGIALVGGLVLSDEHVAGPRLGGYKSGFPAGLELHARDDPVPSIELQEVGVAADVERMTMVASLGRRHSQTVERGRLEAAAFIGVDQLP